jgi:site-specific recombinase XerD
MSPEGGLFDLMAGLYSKGGLPQFGVYLMSHSGDDLITDRVSRKSVRVERPALTCAYAVQPQVVEGLAANAAFRGRGLLARFLYAVPQSWIGRRKIAPEPVADAVYEAYGRMVRALASRENDLTLHLTLDTFRAFKDWESEIEAMLDDGGAMELMKDWGGKVAGSTVRLAAVLHCVEHQSESHINVATIGAAVEIARYLVPHAEVVLTMMQTKEETRDDDARYLLRWIERHGRQKFTKTEAQHHGKRRFPKANDIDPALDELVRRCYVRLLASERAGRGRPLSPTYEVNPALLVRREHLTRYFARRTDVKPNTVVHWRHAERSLLAYLGADRPLASIAAGDARDWERWLKTGKARENRYAERKSDEGLAPNTVRKRVSDAKQFFQDAVSRNLLVKNPFEGLKGTVGSNRDRDYFVDREATAKVLDSCPDAQWRLLFALSRYAGLRCPSEHLALTWADVNWAEGRMLIRSVMTEHHDGKGTRLVPIFPELRPYLEAVWDAAEPGMAQVITRYRDDNSNLRTQLKRIIAKAGLKPWPKLFQNLRASRATKLASEHPAHVAAAWLGHSTLVVNKHYWQVTDSDFTKALAADPKAAQKAARKAAQQAHAETRDESQSPKPAHEKAPVLLGSAIFRETPQNGGMGGTGLEPVTSTV